MKYDKCMELKGGSNVVMCPFDNLFFLIFFSDDDDDDRSSVIYCALRHDILILLLHSLHSHCLVHAMHCLNYCMAQYTLLRDPSSYLLL